MIFIQRAFARRLLLGLSTGLVTLAGSTGRSARAWQLDEVDSTGHSSWADSTFPCDDYGCATQPGESPMEQLTIFSECLNGPQGQPLYNCRCADLTADGRADLGDYALFQNHLMPVCERMLTIQQAPAMGFCPRAMAIHRANVYQTFDGRIVIVGTNALIGDPETDECVPPAEPGCYVSVPFEPLELTREEFGTLASLLNAIPPHPYCPWSVCDPCRTITLGFDDRIVRDDCNICPETIEYSEYVQAAFDYINEFVNE